MWRTSTILLIIAVWIFILSYPKPPHEALSYYSCRYLSIACPETVILGRAESGYEPIKKQFEQNYIDLQERHSQLVIYHNDKLVVDIAGKNCFYSCDHDSYNEDSLQNVFSTTKVVTSIVVAMLVDQGVLDYNEKISTYWPTFGQNGKENVTLEELMKHAAGLTYIDDLDPLTDDRLPLFDGDPDYLPKIAQLIEKAFLHYPVNGTKTAYHGMTQGLILNEVIRRTDKNNRTIGQIVRDEIVPKLNIVYAIGLGNCLSPIDQLHIQYHESDSIAWRINEIGSIILQYVLNLDVPTIPHNLPRAIEETIAFGVNSPMIRAAETINGTLAINIADKHNLPHVRMIESPSSNGITNARSMAKILNEVIHQDKRPEQQKIFKKDATFNYLLNHSHPQYDIAIHTNVSYTTGGWGSFHSDYGPFEGYYGWHGLGGALLITDPEKKIVIAYTTTRIGTRSPWDDYRTLKLLNVINKTIRNH